MPHPQQTHQPPSVHQPYTRPMQTLVAQHIRPTGQQIADAMASSQTTDEVVQCLMGLIPLFSPRGTNPGQDYYLQADEVALLNIVPALKASARPFTLQSLSDLFVRPSGLQQLLVELPPCDAKTALNEYLLRFQSTQDNGIGFDSKRFKETIGGLSARIYLAAGELA